MISAPVKWCSGDSVWSVHFDVAPFIQFPEGQPGWQDVCSKSGCRKGLLSAVGTAVTAAGLWKAVGDRHIWGLESLTIWRGYEVREPLTAQNLVAPRLTRGVLITHLRRTYKCDKPTQLHPPRLWPSLHLLPGNPRPSNCEWLSFWNKHPVSFILPTQRDLIRGGKQSARIWKKQGNS